MVYRRLGILAAVGSIGGFLMYIFPQIVIDGWIANGLPPGAPTLGTIGQTLVLYDVLVGVLGPATTITVGLAVGYYVGQEIDFTNKYRRFGRTVAVGSLFGVAVAWVGTIGLTNTGSLDITSLLLLAGPFVKYVFTVTALFTVSSFAAAAITHFEQEGRPGRPMNTNEQDETTGWNEETRRHHDG